jgi:ring-1,2-phenylacetyl-CoA epoxidase subunit PaaD
VNARGRPGGPHVLDQARAVAATVTDPELPMLTLEDLGVLRDVSYDAGGSLVVSLTPTYSGCPAMATMRDDLMRSLEDEGFQDVSVKVSLSPAWTTDWITERGRRALAEHGISPPGPAPRGPVVLSLSPTRRAVRCPRCGSEDLSLTSEFGSTACKAMYRCRTCLEPFDHIKEI